MDSEARAGTLQFVESPERLLRALHRAVNHVGFYRDYREAVEGATSPAEALSKLPVLGKEDLISRGAELFDQCLDDAFLISETSGTTGGGVLPTPRSADEMNWNTQNLSHVLAMHVRAGRDRLALLHPVVMSPFADACCLACTRQRVPYMRVFSVPTVCDYRRVLQILARYRVTTVLTTPTLAAKLCYERARNGIDEWTVQKFLLTGELLTDAWKRSLLRIGAGAEMRSFVYGASESASCMYGCSHDLYHPVADFAFELMSSDGNEERGNLLVTWLNPGIRPLIRYRTDDYFELVRQCPCGGGVAFRARGRLTAAGRDASSIEALEILLAEGALPVCHYELRFSEPEVSVALFVPGADSAPEASVMADAIRACHPEFHSARVVFNPSDHIFLSAVVPPKVNRVIDSRKAGTPG